VRPFPGASFLFLILSMVASTGAHAQSAAPRAEAGLAAPGILKRLIPGEQFLTPVIRAQQADDFDNPAYPFVEAGEISWSKVEGAAGKSCQDCHGGGQKNSLKRIAATYPKYAPDVRSVITLETRVNLCRRNNLRAAPLAENSEQMIAVTAYLRWLARGTPAQVDVRGAGATVFERGSQLYQTKIGLLQLSCVQCHNERFGQNFGADTLSQGHALSYPAFSIGQGRMITLHERIRMCNQLARAEGQPDDAPDYVALELYLNWRSRDLPITAPGVRQ
jgi:L-cysteine S-thiosulfotransferase